MWVDRVKRMEIDGLYTIESDVNEKKIYEIYNKQQMEKIGLNMKFVQENQSFSYKGVLRGMHVQFKHPQGKCIRVLEGKIYDVVIDLRKKSPTFLQWIGIELSAENQKQFYITEGFAHGFLVMSETATVCYKVTNYWHKNDDFGIRWDDPLINIKWPLKNGMTPTLAKKDMFYSDIQSKLKETGGFDERFIYM